MENASNALLMAAGVLVGILLVTTIVVSFSGASELAKTYDSRIFQDSLQVFNSNFEKYTMANVKLQDIMTLAHFAINFNTKNEFETTNSEYIHVECNKQKLDEMTEQDLIKYMTTLGNNFKLDADGKKEDVTKYQEYKCKTIEYNETTGLVNKIVFEKVK